MAARDTKFCGLCKITENAKSLAKHLRSNKHERNEYVQSLTPSQHYNNEQYNQQTQYQQQYQQPQYQQQQQYNQQPQYSQYQYQQHQYQQQQHYILDEPFDYIRLSEPLLHTPYVPDSDEALIRQQQQQQRAHHFQNV